MRRTLVIAALALLMSSLLSGCAQEPLPTGTLPPPPTTTATTSTSAEPPITSAELTTSADATTTPATSPVAVTPSEATAAMPSELSLPPEAYELPLPIENPPEVPATSEAELADRAAIEATWNSFLDLVTQVGSMTTAEYENKASAIVMDETLLQAIQSNDAALAEGFTSYGRSVAHPYWYAAVDGQQWAIMGDCMDSSNTGRQYADGHRGSPGGAHQNFVVYFARTPEGNWLIYRLRYLVDLPCA